MRKIFILLLFMSVAWATAESQTAAAPQADTNLKPPETVYQPMPKAGRKYEIGDGNYLTYNFSEKPKMGTVILKIQIFNKKGEQITPYLVKGRSDMPSMRGAHDSGDVEFKLNRKNDYLLPVNIVMPGDWEVRVTFFIDGKPVYFGSITFDV